MSSSPPPSPPTVAVDRLGDAKAAPDPLRVFISYARADGDFMRALRKHLSPLEHAGMVQIWADDCIVASEKWSASIDDAIQRADIALLLLSADFFASRFIQQQELPALHARTEQGLKLIPIIIREIDWQSSALAELQAPLQGQAISSPQNDAAWVKVASEIRQLCASAKPSTARALGEPELPAVPIVSRPPALLPPGCAPVARKSGRPPRPRLHQRRLRPLALGLLLGVSSLCATWPREEPLEAPLRAGLEEVSRALDLGDRARAAYLLDKLQGRYPGRPELDLGREVAALYRAGEHDDPQSFYDEVQRLQRQTPQLGGLFRGHLHVAQADRLLFERHWFAAGQAYRSALSARPQLVAAQMGLGLLELWQDRPGQALTWFSRAETEAPESPSIQAALGATQLRLRNLSRALAHYGAAIRRDPGYIAAHLELARAERLAGHPQRAQGVLRLIEGRWSELAAQARNQSPLGYRVGVEVARVAGMQDPPVLFIQGQAQLKYYFELSTALSACLSGDATQQRSSLRQARRLLERGLGQGRALRARLVLLDELDEGNRACLAAIEQAQLVGAGHDPLQDARADSAPDGD